MVQTIPKWQIYNWAYHMADFLLGLPHIREVLVITRGIQQYQYPFKCE